MTDQIEDGDGIDDFVHDKIVDEPAPVADAPPPERPVDPETEALARKYGWRPRGESSLPDGSWMDAERFVAAGKTRLRIQEDKLTEASKRIEAAEAMARTAAETVRRQERMRYDAALSEIQARKEAAVEASDIDTYKKLDEQEHRIRSVPVQPEGPPPEVVAFWNDEKHAWTKDPVLKSFMANAIDSDPQIARAAPIEQLKWADAKVREYFPHKFPAPQPREPETGRYTSSKVDGGGLATGRSNPSHGLSAEESAEVKGLIDKGIFKNVGEYVEYSRKLGVRE
jgi:hypothetical protein